MFTGIDTAKSKKQHSRPQLTVEALVSIAVKKGRGTARLQKGQENIDGGKWLNSNLVTLERFPGAFKIINYNFSSMKGFFNVKTPLNSCLFREHF